MSVTVIETWYLTPEAASNAVEVLQEMDDRLEDNSHSHPGWSGHATFLQDEDDPRVVTWMYEWGSRSLHRDLMELEREDVDGLEAKYCVRPREVRYAAELPVEVEDH